MANGNRPEICNWMVYGLRSERFSVTSPQNIDIYISVPERSEFVTEDGKELAGDYLAREFNKMLKERGIHNYTLKCMTRAGEKWRLAEYEAVDRRLSFL